MPVFRSRISQNTLNWALTILSCLALTLAILPAVLMPNQAQAELRAFRLKITNANGAERRVITRFDHVQYPMYFYVAKSDLIEIEQTWMCYDRSDFLGQLCPAPAQNPGDVSGGPGLPARNSTRSPATASSPQR